MDWAERAFGSQHSSESWERKGDRELLRPFGTMIELIGELQKRLLIRGFWLWAKMVKT